MNREQIDRFARWATPETMRAVSDAGAAAHRDWIARIALPVELHDAYAWCRLPIVCAPWIVWPPAAAYVAAVAACEVAVVAAIWPDDLGDVLGPSVESPIRLP